MKRTRIITTVLYMIIVFAAFSWVMGVFGNNTDGLTYSQVVDQFEAGNVKSFVVQDHVIKMTLNQPVDNKTTLTANLSDENSFREEMMPLITSQKAAGTLVSYDFIPETQSTPYDYVIPALIVGLVILFLWLFFMGRMNNSNPMANFGKAKVNTGEDGKPATFKDVAGAEEEKKELQEVVDFLKHPEKYTEIGAKIPHGILLVGPPGTGKTLLARAVAGEAGVPFLSISGSDFMEMYVGVGASRVRDLFDQAKKVKPSIIFIDEIDAVGRKRGSGMGGGHDEREQTLNQMLVEMDGFGKNEGVIVMAATNRPDILDQALLRPGRFDRQIYVGAPDSVGREEILKVHARGKKMDDSVDLKAVAAGTSGFTGADLANLLNEAAILAIRAGRPVMNMVDVNEAMMKVLAGPEKRSRLRLKKDQWLTAVHEAGHAVAMYNLSTHDPVSQISIIPRGQALGLTWSMPRQESTHTTRKEMYENIVGLLGGRVAEALFLDDISTGASNDIDRASKLARQMVAQYGMNDKLGTISYLSSDEVFIGRDFEKTKGYSEQVAGIIDEQVKILIDQAYQECKDILTKDSEKLKQVAEYLLEHETMTGAQFRRCMEGKEIGEASVTAFFDTEPEEQPEDMQQVEQDDAQLAEPEA